MCGFDVWVAGFEFGGFGVWVAVFQGSQWRW